MTGLLHMPRFRHNYFILSVYAVLTAAAVTELVIDYQGARPQRTVFGIKEIESAV